MLERSTGTVLTPLLDNRTVIGANRCVCIVCAMCPPLSASSQMVFMCTPKLDGYWDCHLILRTLSRQSTGYMDFLEWSE